MRVYKSELYKYPEPSLKDLISTHHPRYEAPRCAAFVIFLSLELQWVTLPCNLSMSDTLTICQTFLRTSQHNSTPITRDYFECPKGWVKVDSSCHQMISRPTQHLSCEEAQAVCKGMFSFSDRSVTIAERTLMYYFEWLNDPQEELFYGGDNNHCFVVQVVQSTTLVSVVKQNGTMTTSPHAAICKTELDPVVYSCSQSQFACADGSCILQHYYCDGKTDCPDGSDERDCSHVCVFSEGVKPSDHTSNCYTDCHHSNCSCHALYYQCRTGGGCIPASKLCDGKVDCGAGEDELDCVDSPYEINTMSVNSKSFTCEDGTLIPISEVDDLVPDCPGGGGEDETNMKLYWSGNINKLPHAYECQPTYTQCIKGLPGVCYPRHKLCVYETYSNKIRYCRNGAHLGNCSSHECPDMFKCPLSYCVPYHYVCNGRLDCPHGEDETRCLAVLQCPGLLRCRHDGVCAHPNNVGDNMTDCKVSKDDETLLGVLKCPASCTCLGNSVICWFVDVDVLNNLWGSIRKLSFQSSTVDTKFCFLIPKLVSLNLTNNEITSPSFPQFCSLPHIRSLNLQNNSIQVLRKNMFRGLRTLKYLELQMNPIHGIGQNAFSDLEQLLLLNLSHVRLKHITGNTFTGLINLVTLDLSYNRLITLEVDSFKAFNDKLKTLLLITNSTPAGFLDLAPTLSAMDHIHVYSATVCPYVGDKATCHFVKAYNGRCCTLIPNLALEIVFWLYGIALLAMSLGSITFWTLCETNKISKLFMIAIHMCASGVSTYPLYMVALNRSYGSYFLFYQESFSTSFHCKAVGIISLLCHYTCTFAVLLTTCHHCILVVYPLKDHSFMERLFPRALPLFLISAVLFTAIPQASPALRALTPIPQVSPALRALTSDSTCQILLQTNKSTDVWSYMSYVLMTAEFVMHASTAMIHFFTSYKLQNAGNGVTAHGGSKLKQKASVRRSLLGSFEILCLAIATIVQVLAVFIGYASDHIFILISGLFFYELLLPLLYTFTTTAFTKAISNAISHT